MKLSVGVRRTRKAAKCLKIGTSGLEIKAKEEDFTTAGYKGYHSTFPSFLCVCADPYLLGHSR